MLNTNISKRYTAEQCIKSLDKWIGEMRLGIEKQCADKGIKDLPKNVKPLASKDLIKKALDNFIQFEAKSIPKVSIYNFFEREMLSNQERLVVTQVFKTLDQEGDGIFSIQEAIDAYRKNCVKDGDNENKSIRESFQRIFKQLNCRHLDVKDDESLTITYSQFCMAAINENVLINKEKVERAFNLFDEVSHIRN